MRLLRPYQSQVDRHAPDLTVAEETVREEVAALLAELRCYHPRDTPARIYAANRLAVAELTVAERALASDVLLPIVTKHASEPLHAPIKRALTACWFSGMAVGWVLWLYEADLYYSGRAITPERLMREFASATGDVSLLLVLLVGPIVAPINVRRCRAANDRVRSQCALALGKLRCRPALTALADLTRSRRRIIRQSTESALDWLLPEVRAADTVPLSPEESLALARAVPRVNTDLARNVLELLERIGSPAALEPLQSLSYQWSYRTDLVVTDLPKRLHRAITRLQERREEQRKRETLLRPAQADESSVLLHPVTSSGEVDPSLLLHVAAEETS